jgi:O-antigen ligase
MYTKVNNFFLALFIILGLIELIVKKKVVNGFGFFVRSWPIISFFVLSVLASFREYKISEFLFLEKHLSLLFVPIVILAKNRLVYHGRRDKIFTFLVLGTVTTLLLCNIYFFLSKGIINPINIDVHEFTKIADTHPTYLGLFIISSIFYLLQAKKIKKPVKAILILFLTYGLIQLVKDITLFLLAFFLIYVLVSYLESHVVRNVLLLFVLGICLSIANMNLEKYLNNNLFSVNTILDDKRIDRWQVSFEIFQENPIYGVGFNDIKNKRKTKYIKGDYELAAANNLNAHNQFLEYLSVNGALGGIFYVSSMGFLFFLAIARKDYLYTFLFLAFILSNITESMMVRIKGIEYFAIFASLFIAGGGYLKDDKNNHLVAKPK